MKIRTHPETRLWAKVTRSHVKTRLWTNLGLENKGLDLATEGFDATSLENKRALEPTEGIGTTSRATYKKPCPVLPRGNRLLKSETHSSRARNRAFCSRARLV